MTTEADISKLLAGLEGERVEFKPALRASAEQEQKLHIIRTVTAFYNTKGGVLVFGVRDKTGEVLGIEDPQQLEHAITLQLRNCVIDLDVSPEFELTEYAGKTLVLVHCPKGPRPPYRIKGYERPFMRQGSSNVEASEDQIAQMFRDRSPDPQDRRIVERAQLEDIDLSAAESYLQKTGFTELQGREAALVLLFNEGLLGKRSDGSYVPTIAGLLLFGKPPQKHLPHAVLKADFKQREEQDEWDDIQSFDGTIFEQIRAAELFLKRHIAVSARIVGFRRVERPAIPLEALREAVVNALVHRDYQDTGAEVHLRIRGANVTLLNPGGMIAPLTIEIVMRGGFAPRSRNGTIAEALIRLGGYMEKRGTGIARMRRLCEAAQLPAPEFIEQAGTFSVVFKATSAPERIELPEQRVVISEEELRRLALTEPHFEILELVQDRGAVRPGEVEKQLQKSRPFVNARLDELVEKLVLIRSSESKFDPNVTFKLHPRFTDKPGPSGQAKLL